MSKINPKTLRLVYCATFIAIAVVVGSFLSFYLTESIKFNLAPVVIMLTGAVLGPIWGAAAGGITDLLSFLIGTAAKPGPYFPGFTVTMVLYGLVSGLIFYRKKHPSEVPSIAKISLGTALTQTVCSLLINSFWNYLLYGPTYAPALYIHYVRGVHRPDVHSPKKQAKDVQVLVYACHGAALIRTNRQPEKRYIRRFFIGLEHSRAVCVRR